KIVSCPNCTTIPFVMVLQALHREAGLGHVVVTTLQSVSGSGKPGVEELEAQTEAVVRGEPLHAEFYPEPIAHNLLPLCGTFPGAGYSTEEMKLALETRKILGLPGLEIAMQCIRVPVPVGHSLSMLVETQEPLDPDRARRVLAAFPGIAVVDDPSRNVFPTPARAAGRDEVLVGRIRRDLESDRLWLFVCSDHLRKS